jgi:hypothetical protein
MSIKISIVLLMLLPGLFAQGPGQGEAAKGQWTEAKKEDMSKILEALNNHFLKMHYYSMNITDASYADYTTLVYHEKSAGYFIRQADHFHSFILGVHTLQDKYCRLIVDSSQKKMMISDPMDYFDQSLNFSDYNELFKLCSKIQVAHSPNQIAYRMEFAKGSPYSAYQITLKDSLPQKIVMYYSNPVQGSGEKMKAVPRMEITFDNWKTNSAVHQDNWQISKYVDFNKKENKYTLKTPYAGKYTLFDGRVLTKANKS